MLLGLGRFARDAAADSAVRALLIVASGDRAFCAGADLKERAGWSDDEVRKQLLWYRTELGALDASPKPVIAAMNGAALGGGLEVALACDLRICAPHARFGFPEVGLGIIPGAGGTQRVTRMIGASRAKEMILLGRRLSACEALEWGLVHRVTPDKSDVETEALRWMEPLVAGAPIAMAAALQAVDAAGPNLDTGLEVERIAYERTLGTDDRLEGLRAFAEKRRPIYRGK